MLMKNQRVVWDKEQDVIQEKKKLEQLRREKEEERQFQHLQQLQHSSTGHKPSDRMEWMYAAPAASNNLNSSEMEDYLLGKKRVDKILKGEDEKGLYGQQQEAPSTSHANPRDTSAKVKLDPILAIKQQEQAAYDALINNPIKLREMREKAGQSSGRLEKEERKKAREEKRRLKEAARDDREGYRGRDRYDRYDDRYSHSHRSGDDSRYKSRYDDDRYKSRHRSHRDYSPPPRSQRSHRPSPRRKPSHSPPPQQSRAEKLAAMTASAQSLQSERDARLAEMERKDAIEKDSDSRARSRDVKYGGHNQFIANEQRKVYSGDGGLAEQMRRRG